MGAFGAGKCLIFSLVGRGMGLIVVFVNFCGINTLNTSDFNLSIKKTALLRYNLHTIVCTFKAVIFNLF